jgi:hypothetical protein
MSLDHQRIVAEAVAKLEAQGFNRAGAPKVGNGGLSGLEVVIDALADATVHEIEVYGQGGATSDFDPLIFVQTTPATTWGPILHGRGRPVSVETIDPAGDEFDCVVRNSPDMNSVTIFLGLAIAGKALIF